MKINLVIFLLLLVFSTSGCSSVITSSLAFAVSKNSEINAKRNKRFTAISRCVEKDTLDAFEVSRSIENGAEISYTQNRIINTLEEDAKLPDFPRHHISYAFLIIAEKMKDSRAAEKKNWYLQNYPKQELDEIEKTIDYKYYLSHLRKCFYVPEKYRIYMPIREMYKRNW